MRRSHVCCGCGSDIRRERVSREPHYGLPIVVCPSCGTVAVRRRPTEARIRSVRQLVASMSAVGLQFAILVFSTVLVTIVCDEVVLRDDVIAAFRGDAEAVTKVLFGVTILPVAIGAWLTVGFTHWRRRLVWPAYFALPLFFCSLEAIIVPAIATNLVEGWAVPAGTFVVAWERWVDRLVTLAAMMSIALAGIPLGLSILAAHAHVRRVMWRARRRRFRARSLQ